MGNPSDAVLATAIERRDYAGKEVTRLRGELAATQTALAEAEAEHDEAEHIILALQAHIERKAN